MFEADRLAVVPTKVYDEHCACNAVRHADEENLLFAMILVPGIVYDYIRLGFFHVQRHLGHHFGFCLGVGAFIPLH